MCIRDRSFLKEAIIRINPHRVQLNSLDRPGTERGLVKEPDEKLQQIAQFLKPLPVEIITRRTTKAVFPEINQEMKELLISTIKRRPCTAEDMAKILHLHIDEVAKYLHHLYKTGVIEVDEQESGVFYSLHKDDQN